MKVEINTKEKEFEPIEVKTEKNKDKVIAGLKGRISTLNYLILKRVKFSGK